VLDLKINVWEAQQKLDPIEQNSAYDVEKEAE
jgi:hypothetical protein